jgi:hypothetical protein
MLFFPFCPIKTENEILIFALGASDGWWCIGCWLVVLAGGGGASAAGGGGGWRCCAHQQQEARTTRSSRCQDDYNY